MVLIRTAKVEDAAGIFETHSRSIREICAKDYTPEQIEGWFPITRTPQDYATQIAREGSSMFVVEIAGKIAAISRIEEDKVRLFYIHPEFTGNGISKKLFCYTEEALRQGGHKKMLLNSSTTAYGFYLKMGMRLVEETTHTLNSGVSVPVMSMEKDL